MLTARTEQALAWRSYGVRVGEIAFNWKRLPELDLDLALGWLAIEPLAAIGKTPPKPSSP